MRVVILAGGRGTRLSEETNLRPKPMVEIGGLPILYHIMQIYSEQGFNNFIIAGGFQSLVIKEYFSTLRLRFSNLHVETGTGEMQLSGDKSPSWTVTVVDTGMDTMTGGRLGRLQDVLAGEDFMLTYGDGLANVDLQALLSVHNRTNSKVTLTAVRPPARFGAINFNGDMVSEFDEKPNMGEGWINGGFMVVDSSVLKFAQLDDCVLERDILTALAAQGQLAAHKHYGFWHPMDTLRDKHLLEELWGTGHAPWTNQKSL